MMQRNSFDNWHQIVEKYYKRKHPLKVFISKGVHIAVAQNLIPKIPSKRVSDQEEGKDYLGLIIPFNESVRVSPDLL